MYPKIEGIPQILQDSIGNRKNVCVEGQRSAMELTSQAVSSQTVRLWVTESIAGDWMVKWA
jgi:hypothetical protein